jgi:alanine racemase
MSKPAGRTEADIDAAFASDKAACGILTVDLAALTANWRDCAARAKPAECSAVVKADAYGTGLEPVAAALAKAGCKTFFVALLDEALRLRTVAPEATIYVLNGLNPGTCGAFADIDARPVLGSMPEIEEWDRFAKETGEPLAAAIHIDTGMSRHGLSVDEASALAGKLNALAFKPSLVMSHLARADEIAHPMTARQVAVFKAIAAKFPGVPASLANSAGLLAHPDTRFDLVRPGIALYGGRALIDGENLMKPVVRLDIRIV